MSNTAEADTLFVNATIITGNPGDPPFVASLLVSHGLIRAISPIVDPSTLRQGTRVVDCTGLYLCPGFIDLHAHSDLYLLTHGRHEAKLTQGVTVGGSDRSIADGGAEDRPR
jgi:N-acyl-D-aspartate/D-glutamate deacylase